MSDTRLLDRRGQFQQVVILVRSLADVVRINARAASLNRRRGYRGWIGAEVTDYDPLDPVVAADPYPHYARMHAGGRVHYSPRRKIWILSRFEDVRAAARACDVLINGEGTTLTRFAVPILATSDGELHTRLRKQVQPAFTRAAMTSWTQVVNRLATELVDDVIADPGCDVVERLAVPLPMTLIAHLLGVPDDDLAAFRAWSAAVTSALDIELTPRGLQKMRATAIGGAALWRFFNEQFDRGTLIRPETLLGRLIAENEGDAMSRIDLYLICILLLVAGNETTTNLLGSLFDALARNPEQFQLLRRDPDLVPAAVEEALRHASPIQALYRTAREDYQVGPVTIPAGSRVMLSFAAANRDPSAFEEPDEFRVERGVKLQHVAFGFGVHMCIGVALARLEATAVLRELVAKTERIEPMGETVWSENSSLRGPLHLPVRLVPDRTAG